MAMQDRMRVKRRNASGIFETGIPHVIDFSRNTIFAHRTSVSAHKTPNLWPSAALWDIQETKFDGYLCIYNKCVLSFDIHPFCDFLHCSVHIFLPLAVSGL